MATRIRLRLRSLVQLRKLQAGRNVRHRFRYKVALAWELYGRDYSADYVLKLLRFMDYILTLPAALVEQYRGELQRIEEKLKMPYLTTFEQKAMEKGIEQGIETGNRKGDGARNRARESSKGSKRESNWESGKESWMRCVRR